MTFEAVVVGLHLTLRPVGHLDYSGRDLRRQRRTPVVAAQVVVEVEAFDALQAMEGHPLGEVASLVEEDRADGQLDRRTRSQRARPARTQIADAAIGVPRRTQARQKKSVHAPVAVSRS